MLAKTFLKTFKLNCFKYGFEISQSSWSHTTFGVPTTNGKSLQGHYKECSCTPAQQMKGIAEMCDQKNDVPCGCDHDVHVGSTNQGGWGHVNTDKIRSRANGSLQLVPKHTHTTKMETNRSFGDQNQGVEAWATSATKEDLSKDADSNEQRLEKTKSLRCTAHKKKTNSNSTVRPFWYDSSVHMQEPVVLIHRKHENDKVVAFLISDCQTQRPKAQDERNVALCKGRPSALPRTLSHQPRQRHQRSSVCGGYHLHQLCVCKTCARPMRWHLRQRTKPPMKRSFNWIYSPFSLHSFVQCCSLRNSL